MKSSKPLKGVKKAKPTHTSREKIGQGDFYGAAINQKWGRTIDLKLDPYAGKKKKFGKPPKKLA